MVASAFYRRALCVAVPLLIAITTSLAGEVQLSWNPSAGATEYTVYRGTSSGQYSDSFGVGNATQTPVDGLGDCMAWYFAVTASNSAGESGHSTEVVSWPRAVLDQASPATADQGTQLDVVVSGTNFRDGDVIEITNPGVQIDAVGVTCNALTLSLTVAADAPTGPADISVTHPSGVTGVGVGLLTIEVPPADETPPEITGVQATSVDGTSALITWTTDEPADSHVLYRKQGHEIFRTAMDSAEVTEHAVQLTGLEPETGYEFHVSSTDAAGNTATTSPDDTFTTTASPYTYLRFEAESAVLADPVRMTSGDAAFGGAWIDTPAGANQGTAQNPAGTATHGVNVPEPGTWFLWVRMYAANGSSNTWYESIDGASRQQISTATFGEWTWVAGREYALDAGLHAVELGGREPETRADRLLLTNDPGFVPNEQPDVDITPPGAVEQFTATPGAGQIELSWFNPVDGDVERTIVRYRTDGYPTSPVDGLPLADLPASPGTLDQHVHDGVEVGANYYYSAFSVDAEGNVSEAAYALGAVVGLPPPPQNLSVY
jgi:hypothetical protein